MANQQVNIPDIGDFDSVEIIEILVSVGDVVAIDDSLLTLESDKATMEIPSPVAGTVTKINVEVGGSVAEGDYVIDIQASADDAAPAPQTEEKPAATVTAPVAETPAPAASKPAPAPKQTESASPVALAAASRPVNAQDMGEISHASPSVRAFARKLGVELSAVDGTGPKGRVQQTDVENAIKAVMSGAASAPGQSAMSGTGIPSIPEIDFSKFGETTTEELGRIKKISGKFLHASWLNVPHVTDRKSVV